MLYGTAGLAYAELAVDPDNAAAFEAADTAGFVGFGADMMVTEDISIGGEVLLHDFEDFDSMGFDMNLTTAMLRVSYHF